MRYWHRPRFWLFLTLNEIAVVILSTLLSTGVAAVVASLGIPAPIGLWIDLAIWTLITSFLSYSAYCDVRDQALLRPSPSPRAFPVILPDNKE